MGFFDFLKEIFSSGPSGKIGRNDPCYCGSGKKYKHCHLIKDEEAREALRGSEINRANEPTYGSDVSMIGGIANRGFSRAKDLIKKK